ncbi:MAG TPA: M23 family metallopeptidase [Chloroflexaceae bacterium]|nr:M23 family metallopeptidase [Chloroflexaceae bacterium]
MASDEQHLPRRRLWRPRPIWLAYLGLVGLLGTLHRTLAPLRPLALDGLVYVVLLVTGWLVRLLQPQAAEAKPERSELPLPGPAERRGPGWFMGRYLASSLLTLLNPLQLAQLLLQVGGQGLAWLRWRGRHDQLATYCTAATYTLPVQGPWLVYKGGVTPETSHSWDVLAQRYAYDFVVADESGRRNPEGQGERVAEYHAYGQPIVAPADGVVVRVRDAPAPGSGWINWLSADFRGNFVVIRHSEGEYSVLAHLVPEQIVVRVGQQVARGELIGRCGNSRHSTEPHLHFHLQDYSNFFLAMGLPLSFQHVSFEGAAPHEVALEGGMRVVAREPLPGGDKALRRSGRA